MGEVAITKVVTTDAIEQVVLHNTLSVEADLGMWSMRDSDGDRIPIPADTKIPVGKSLTVFTGRGSSTATRLYVGLPHPVLEKGERVWLLDSGESVVSCYPSASPCPSPPPARG